MENNSNINMQINVFELIEHKCFKEEHKELVRKLDIQFCKTGYEKAPKYLGVYQQYGELRASYYIGADWLCEKRNKAIVVTPKMPDIDLMKMYMCALKFDLPADYFSKFYHIDFEKKAIKTTSFRNQLTPLLVIHFLSILKKLTKRGLKKDYIIREDNLRSKVKGKICISKNIKINNINKRDDRIYCQFQEYSVNNLENRLLKKALLFAQRYIQCLNEHKSYNALRSLSNSLLSAFTDVSDEIEVYQVKRVIANKIFKEYKYAISVAKMILKKFDYSITKTHDKSENTPVFWIDMSRLYEVYIYSLLHEKYGSDIKFQVSGYHKTAVDFLKLSDKIIIDTKYKPKYDGSNGGILDDVRQISAYARDTKILTELYGISNETNNTPSCLIIYPEKMVNVVDNEERDSCNEIVIFKTDDSILFQSTKIEAFNGFYKLSIPLPKK